MQKITEKFDQSLYMKNFRGSQPKIAMLPRGQVTPACSSTIYSGELPGADTFFFVVVAFLFEVNTVTRMSFFNTTLLSASKKCLQCVVRNSLLDGQWGNEEREGKIPFEKAIVFDLEIKNEVYAYQVRHFLHLSFFLFKIYFLEFLLMYGNTIKLLIEV